MAFFLDDIDECLWDYLRRTTKKIVLYGMGDGAEKIKSALDGINVPVADIMASDEFVRGHDFLGFRVKKLSEIERLYGDDFLILVCFGSSLPDVMGHIRDISAKHELYAPNVPVVGKGLFTLDYAREHRAELLEVYGRLADERSKEAFEGIIRYKLSGELGFLRACESPCHEMYELLKIGGDETYVDLGAYNGDTVRQFLDYTKNSFKRIYALEPDYRNYKKLKICLDALGDKAEAYNAGAWNGETTMLFGLRAGRSSKVEGTSAEKPSSPAKYREVSMMSVDGLLKGNPATFIKYDVEGSEREAIEGAKNTIAEFGPKLSVALYHRNEDMFAIPLQILGINPDYRLYMRHHPYIPDWDTNLYAICD